MDLFPEALTCTLMDGAWHHYHVVGTAETVTVYIDGIGVEPETEVS